MLTTKYVRSIFDYDRCTGNLIWRASRGGRTPENLIAGWKEPNRYTKVTLDNKTYYAHHIVWIWHCRVLPQMIDHINLDKQDNRIENLRAVTPSQSQCNHPITIKNKSGIKGVSWNKRLSKWQVRVQVQKRAIWCGLFNDLEFATLVAVEARNKYHGEYARHA